MRQALQTIIAYCAAQHVSLEIDGRRGQVWLGGDLITPEQLLERLGGQPRVTHRTKLLGAPGYDELAEVLHRAFQQAASGKGKERHAGPGEAFVDQVILQGAQRFGTGALLFQAFKKSEESQRLPHERGVAELLGAIVYLAAAVIAEERKHHPRTEAANDPSTREAGRA